MTAFFNSTAPLLRSKQTALDVQDLYGLLKLRWQLGGVTLFSGLYTRIDQALILWGLITIAIFATAQFSAIDWATQARVGTALTLVGTIVMVSLTNFWGRVEGLSWVVYTWAGLMLTGLVVTDVGIFQGWGTILLNLCPLWLGLCGLGYLLTGIGLRSRIFLLTSLFHWLGIPLLAYVEGWQFLVTGLLMGGSLLLLSELQWDMRSPLESEYLTGAQRRFNREQHYLRQIMS